MTSGTRTAFDGARRRTAIALAAAVALVAPLPAFAFTLTELMALLAQNRSGEAAFTEQRFVKGFDEPLEASGTLSFRAPDQFVRRTLKPRAETLAVEGNTLVIARGGRSRSTPLDAAPEMIAIVEAMRGTLTGSGETLQRHFRTALSGSAGSWSLALAPIEASVGRYVRGVRIDGRRAEMHRFEIDLADGDRSVMNIEPLRPARTAPP